MLRKWAFDVHNTQSALISSNLGNFNSQRGSRFAFLNNSSRGANNAFQHNLAINHNYTVSYSPLWGKWSVYRLNLIKYCITVLHAKCDYTDTPNIWVTHSHKGVNLGSRIFYVINVCEYVCMRARECVRAPQVIVDVCSSLPCSNIRPCRHLGPVVWALGGGSRLATGPDYFLHSPELNSVYAINRCTLGDPNSTVPLTLYTKDCLQTHTQTHMHYTKLHSLTANLLWPQLSATSSIILQDERFALGQRGARVTSSGGLKAQPYRKR